MKFLGAHVSNFLVVVWCSPVGGYKHVSWTCYLYLQCLFNLVFT